MKRFSLQVIRAPRPFGVDEGDLPWEPVPGYTDYTSDEDEAWSHADEFDAAFDYMYIHRVVANDTEPS